MFLKYFASFIIGIIILINPAYCDGPTEPPKMEIILNDITYIQEVPMHDGITLNSNILFIFDCSGSMYAGKIEEALTFFTGISSQPTDQMQFAVLAFDANSGNSEGLYRWDGIPEDSEYDPIPKGWAGLPSPIAIQKAIEWVNDTRNRTGGSTNVVPAIQRAFLESRKNLSIVLVTDGEFNDDVPIGFESASTNAYVIKSLQNAIDFRKSRGLTPAAMMVYGIGKTSDVLTKLANIGGAGYYRKKPIEYNEDGE